MGWLLGDLAVLLLALFHASVWTRWGGAGLAASIASVPALLFLGWGVAHLLLLGEPWRVYDVRALWPLTFLVSGVPWVVLGLFGWALGARFGHRRASGKARG